MLKQNRAIELRLYPNKEQQVLLNKTFGCVRKVYRNYGVILCMLITLVISNRKIPPFRVGLVHEQMIFFLHNKKKDMLFGWNVKSHQKKIIDKPLNLQYNMYIVHRNKSIR